jgi:uncharacterized membrane protein
MKHLLINRQFWAAFIVLIIIIIAAISPGFELDADQAAAFVIVITSYIIGVTVDPGPGGWRGIIQSRKFWAAIVGLIILTLDAFRLVLPFGLSPESLISIAMTIGALIASAAIEGPPKTIPDEHDVQSYG